MGERIVHDDASLEGAVAWVAKHKPPFKLTLTKGSLRSLSQNALTHQWYKEMADQREDMTVDQVRAECKMIFGVPILRAENEKFREAYDRCLKGHRYEDKLYFIEVSELPVTRLMTVKQLATYLDKISEHCYRHGIFLSLPQEAQVHA